MDYLCECTNDRDRRQALKQLPPDLPSSYERILHRLNKSSKQNQTLVVRCLQWIVYAKRPLSMNEILQALSVEDDDVDLDRSALSTEEDVLHWCSSLVRRRTAKGGGLELAHFTVKEFLLAIDETNWPGLIQYQLNETKAEILLGITCLRFLNFEFLGRTPLPNNYEDDKEMAIFLDSLREYDFILYAAEFWDYHSYEHIYDCQDIRELAFKLFNPAGCKHFYIWKILRCAEENYDYSNSDGYDDTSPLHWAAGLALDGVCAWLIEQGLDVDGDSILGTPLKFAICSDAILDENGSLFYELPESSIWRVNHRVAVLKQLIQAGANQDFLPRSRPKRTYLDLALDIEFFQHGEQAISETLFDAGGLLLREEIDQLTYALLNNWENEYGRDGETYPPTLNLDSMEHMIIVRAWNEKLDSDSREAILRLALFVAGRGIVPRVLLAAFSLESMLQVTGIYQELIDLIKLSPEARKPLFLNLLIRLVQATSNDSNSVMVTLAKALLVALKIFKFDIAERLLQEELNLIQTDGEGNTALHLALTNQLEGPPLLFQIIKSLIERTENLDILNDRNEHVIHLAARTGDGEIFALIWGTLPDLEMLEAETVDGKTPFHYAIEGKSEVVIEFMLRKYSEHERTPSKSCLQFAISQESTLALELLLDWDLNLGDVDRNGRTALTYAASLDGSLAAFNLLIARGVRISACDENGDTALHILSAIHDELSLQKLAALLHNFSILEVLNGQRMTALSLASKSGNVEGIKMLLGAGADINGTGSHHGATALHWAAQAGADSTIDFLINKGAQLEAQTENGSTPLLTAAQWTNWNTVRHLLIRGASITPRMTGGDHILHLAARAGSIHVVEYILGFFPNVDLEDRGQYQATPLLLSCFSACEEVFNLLFSKGARIDQRCELGTIAHFAVQAGGDNIRNILMQHDVDWGAKTTYKLACGEVKDATPLHVAAARGWTEAIQFLLHNSLVKIDVPALDGITPLHLAVMENCAKSLEVLSSSHADIVLPDNASGNTPLHSAAKAGFGDVVGRLIGFGSNPEIKNFDGSTALELAISQGHWEIANVIQHAMKVRLHKTEVIGLLKELERLERTCPACSRELPINHEAENGDPVAIFTSSNASVERFQEKQEHENHTLRTVNLQPEQTPNFANGLPIQLVDLSHSLESSTNLRVNELPVEPIVHYRQHLYKLTSLTPMETSKFNQSLENSLNTSPTKTVADNGCDEEPLYVAWNSAILPGENKINTGPMPIVVLSKNSRLLLKGRI